MVSGFEWTKEKKETETKRKKEKKEKLEFEKKELSLCCLLGLS